MEKSLGFGLLVAQKQQSILLYGEALRQPNKAEASTT